MQYRFKLCPSKISLILGMFFYLGAIGIASILSTIPALKLGLMTSLLLRFFFFLRKEVFLLNNSSLIEIGCDSEGIWMIKNKSGKYFLVSIIYPVFVSNMVIILQVRSLTNNQKFSLSIFKDTMKKDDYRKLKALLRINREKAR